MVVRDRLHFIKWSPSVTSLTVCHHALMAWTVTHVISHGFAWSIIDYISQVAVMKLEYCLSAAYNIIHSLNVLRLEPTGNKMEAVHVWQHCKCCFKKLNLLDNILFVLQDRNTNKRFEKTFFYCRCIMWPSIFEYHSQLQNSSIY